jgi:hypothetical protein
MQNVQAIGPENACTFSPYSIQKNVTFQKNSPKKNGKKSIVQKILQMKNW